MGNVKRCSIRVASTWKGEPIAVDEAVELDLELRADRLTIDVRAPFHADPPPASAPGSCSGLWEYEVVELFLLGADDRYVEIELGPHGQFLVLTLHGSRALVADGHPLDYSCGIEGVRWWGSAQLDASLLPDGLTRHNAYAIHGEGKARRYLAAHAMGGDLPDFHRLDAFQLLNWNEAGA